MMPQYIQVKDRAYRAWHVPRNIPPVFTSRNEPVWSELLITRALPTHPPTHQPTPTALSEPYA